MLGFLKTLLIILLVIMALRLLARIAMPYLLQFIAKKASQRVNSMFNEAQGKQNTPEGEVQIDRKPKSRPRDKEPVGEYIEYEEIE
ncbi:DUF4834 family protein [Croceiramulus getboli]|nr:DUF4834 family protein [Flavobacteriaceae bacterium YJPT1-3]